MLGRDAQNHVHMVGTRCPFDDLHFDLLCEEADDLADLHSGLTVEDMLAIFG